MRKLWLAIALGLPAAVLAAPPAKKSGPQTVHHSLVVTATAYNGVPAQTDAHPHLGAWGDRLDQLPRGTRAVAVSPDLVALGLKRGKHLRIGGLKGEFVVLDKTPAQWTRRIDIYMHHDVEAAQDWGKRRVKIYWTTQRSREPAPKP